jgi:large subunit ribosomal protein L24
MPALPKKLLQQNLIEKWKLLKGDLVQITTGKDKGKRGVIKKVLREKNRVVVDGCNLVKKNIKRTEERAGYSIMKEAPLHSSNVSLICPDTDKPTKVAWRFLEDGKKVRMAKESGSVVVRPEPKKRVKRPSNPYKDTDSEETVKKTWTDEEQQQLVNYYLIKFEKQYLNHLKQVAGNTEKSELKRDLDDKLFQMRVLKRAKELLKEDMEAASASDSLSSSMSDLSLEEKTKETSTL